LEADLIIGKNHKQAIVTINDRASGMLKMKKVPSKEANVEAKATKCWKIEILLYIPLHPTMERSLQHIKT